MNELNFNNYLGTGGDEVSHYKNIYEGKFEDFIKLVLERKTEFGSIYISNTKSRWDADFVLQYDCGKIIKATDFYDKLKNRNIKVYSGDGGWGLMDYYCIIANDEKPIYYPVYKLRKGDIIPVTLNQAIKQTDMIFNSGAFKVVDIRKDEIAGAVFKVEYIKEEEE